jgi:hypothetical protein
MFLSSLSLSLIAYYRLLSLIAYQMMMSTKITITPIGTSVKNSKSLIDFQEQVTRSQTMEGGIWCWDDSRYNKATEGELFAFFFPRSKRCAGEIVLHRITGVKSPAHRLPSWASNVGQGDRNVLELSPPIKKYTMEEWESNGGPMSKMGTYQTDLKSWGTLYYAILNDLNA